MLLMKFDYDWPAGFREIHVWKCERTHGRTHTRTPAWVPYYKLTLSLRLWWANNSKTNLHIISCIKFSSHKFSVPIFIKNQCLSWWQNITLIPQYCSLYMINCGPNRESWTLKVLQEMSRVWRYCFFACSSFIAKVTPKQNTNLAVRRNNFLESGIKLMLKRT